MADQEQTLSVADLIQATDDSRIADALPRGRAGGVQSEGQLFPYRTTGLAALKVDGFDEEEAYKAVEEAKGNPVKAAEAYPPLAKAIDRAQAFIREYADAYKANRPKATKTTMVPEMARVLREKGLLATSPTISEATVDEALKGFVAGVVQR